MVRLYIQCAVRGEDYCGSWVVGICLSPRVSAVAMNIMKAIQILCQTWNIYRLLNIYIYIYIFFLSPMPPTVRTNFVVFPPGCGDSVADF